MNSSARLTGKSFAVVAFAFALLFALASATATQAYADNAPFQLKKTSAKAGTTYAEEDYSYAALQKKASTKVVTHLYEIAGLDKDGNSQTYSVYHTTNYAAPLSDVLDFADDNDEVTINGHWLSSKTAKKVIVNGKETHEAEPEDGSISSYTKEELVKADARIALIFAGSKSDEPSAAEAEKAEDANLKTIKATPNINNRFCPALFVDYSKLTNNSDETRAFVVTSITVKDVLTNGKWNMDYASVKNNPAAQTYTGKALTPAVTLDYCGHTVKPRTIGTATNAGTHSIVVSDSDFSGSKTVSFTIGHKSISGTPKLSYSSIAYNGTYRKPSVSGVSGTYNTSYSNNLNAGTAKVTLTGTGNYDGTLIQTFTIKPIAQSFTVDKSVKKESYVSTQAGNHATAKYKVKGAKGKVTFTKVGGSSRLKVNGSTSCRLMIKKGTAKGTYKAKIKVTAAASGNYKKTSKTVWLTVKVK